MKRSIPRTQRLRRCMAVLPMLLFGAVLGCRDDEGGPTAPAEAVPSEVAAAATLSFRQVSAGDRHTCGINPNNRAFCWGENTSGQLGDGTNTDHRRPAAVATTLQFRQVDAAQFGTCALTTDDRLFCWGTFPGLRNTRPQQVGGSLRFRNISASGQHVCAVRRDDERAYCWGWNFSGQLGVGDKTDRSTPTAVAGGRRFRLLAAGLQHTCGVTTADEIFCWGDARWGQMGDDSSPFVDHLTPTRVAGTRRYANLTAGQFHTCAVTIASKAFCWGRGNSGQIGDGNDFHRFLPRAVAGGLTFRRLSAGEQHTCGETTNNRAYCWGADVFGELGDGSASDPALRPTAVVGGLQFAQVSAGAHFTCGRTTTDVGYCWGFNAAGQLGDGTGTHRSTPTPIIGPT